MSSGLQHHSINDRFAPEAIPRLPEFLKYLKSPESKLQGAAPQLTSSPLCIEVALRHKEGFDYDAIYEHFSGNFSPKFSEAIIKHLKRCEAPSRDPDAESISCPRCFVLPSNTVPYDRWAGMLWNEGNMEILQLYHVDESGFCNYLTHYGEGKKSTSEGKKYVKSAIGWQVNALEKLWPLCVAAQHLTWTTFVREAASSPLDRPTRARSREKYFFCSKDTNIFRLFVEALDLMFSKALGINNTYKLLETLMPLFEEKSNKGPGN